MGAYRCEWKETLEDPERLARFAIFANTDVPDPSLARVRVRGQGEPA